MHNLFVVEGVKAVGEFLNTDYRLNALFVTDESLFQTWSPTIISEKELNQISNLKNPNKVLALFDIPDEVSALTTGLILALDQLNDPGNLGTIIRLCDWFDIQHILCSKDTVNCYNPKVVQSTMGSLSRVNVHYVDLEEVLSNLTLPVFGADMEGENVYQLELPSEGILLMGNEANGISSPLLNLIDRLISIPQFSKDLNTESLNVATATSILISEFRRGSLLES